MRAGERAQEVDYHATPKVNKPLSGIPGKLTYTTIHHGSQSPTSHPILAGLQLPASCFSLFYRTTEDGPDAGFEDSGFLGHRRLIIDVLTMRVAFCASGLRSRAGHEWSFDPSPETSNIIHIPSIGYVVMSSTITSGHRVTLTYDRYAEDHDRLRCRFSNEILYHGFKKPILGRKLNDLQANDAPHLGPEPVRCDWHWRSEAPSPTQTHWQWQRSLTNHVLRLLSTLQHTISQIP